MFLSSYVRLEEDEEEEEDDEEETQESSSKLSESEKTESDKENIQTSENVESSEGESSKKEVPKKRDRRRLSAEERAKNLENSNDENGCGGVVLEGNDKTNLIISSYIQVQIIYNGRVLTRSEIDKIVF